MKAGRSIEAAGGDEVTSPAHGGEVIGRCTTCDSDEHPYLRGYEVVVVAVLKNALRTEEYEYLTIEDAVHAAGGVGPDDRVEVAVILPEPGQGGRCARQARAPDREAERVARRGRAPASKWGACRPLDLRHGVRQTLDSRARKARERVQSRIGRGTQDP